VVLHVLQQAEEEVKTVVAPVQELERPEALQSQVNSTRMAGSKVCC